MDQELQTLSIQLSEVAVRQTAGAIADRVQTLLAKKRDRETIAELEEIVNDLVSDKAELVRIAQAFEQELVAQRIAPVDIEYITSSVVPVLTSLVASGAAGGGADPDEMRSTIELLKPLLSVETVTVLQLIGFNFREGIGQPLTELVRRLILSKAEPDPAIADELQLVAARQNLVVLEIVKDPEASARLAQANS